MKTVLITGGTGLIGTRLAQMLIEKGYQVIVLTRNIPDAKSIGDSIQYACWDIEHGVMDDAAITQSDYIIHLAGAGVADKRWTEKRKKEIADSRTKSSALLLKKLAAIPNKVKAVISSSAIGWYGPDNQLSAQHGFKEDTEAAPDFLGNTCKAWEESILPSQGLNKRLVIIRTGIVLSNLGGAFAEFKKPLKAGIAAILGNGKQVISWIHIDDICRIFLYALEHEKMEGRFNGVAPNPATNKALTIQLAKMLRRKMFIPVHVPSIILKIMLGEMSIEVLKSTTVSAEKIKSAGFTFLYPSLEAALGALTGPQVANK